MRKKWRKVVAIALLCVVTLGACGVQIGEVEEKEGEIEDKIQIGMCFDSFVIERWQRDRDVFVSMAKELGAEVNVQNANGDLDKQKEQIQYFIDKGMDVIVIIAIDSNGLSDSVKKAKDAGIKVVAYDRLIYDADVDLYISFDNEKVGALMAETLIENGISGGKVLMLGGSLTDYNVIEMEAGFKEVMDKNDVTVMDSFHAEGWLAELAAEYVYDHVQEVRNADAIMCGNDNLASLVIDALAEKRLLKDVLVVGQDADLGACQHIVEGTQLMTVYKPVEKLAQKAAEYAVMLGKGEEIDNTEVKYISNKNYIIPYVALEPISVTADNMNEVIIESGFHLKEDVYLNVPNLMP